MVKAGAEYYNLEKVAEVLSVPTAEVNRLREQGKLRGFRDGSAWKFLKEDIHTYLAESIRARSAGAGSQASGDSDFDLASSDAASASSFDLLMEDAALPDDSDLVAIAPAHSKSDLDLAALDQEDSDLALAEETQISSMVMLKKAKAPEEPKSDAIQKDDDSSALLLAAGPEFHEVELDEQDSVLDAGSSSPQLGLAGDGEFDVLLSAEDDNILQLDEEKTEAIAPPMVEDFDLEPSAQMAGDDDSESSSQVIAIDVGLSSVVQDEEPFGGDNFNFMEFDSGVHTPSAPAAVTSDPFGNGAEADALPMPDVFTPPPAVSPAPAKKPAVTEEEYSTGMLITLVCALVFLLLPGLMLIDQMVSIWSWNEPFFLNSMLMSTIAGWLGL